MEAKELTFDFMLSAAQAVIPQIFDLAEGEENPALKRRILAISEGKHNGTVFRAEEIEKMVKAATALKKKESRSYFAVPIVLDHSYRFIDKVGATFGLNYSEIESKKGGKLPAALADIEFWQDTPMQKEVAARVARDPENTYFSVRVRGMLHYQPDPEEYFWTDLNLIHIAVVNDPADTNARIIEELGADSDFSLNAISEKETGMETVELQKRIGDLEKGINSILGKFDAKEKEEAAQAQAADQEDLMERATLIAEVLNLDNDTNRDFLKGLTKDQLTAYKADLERRLPTESTEKGQAADQAAGQPIEDLARKLLGEE